MDWKKNRVLVGGGILLALVAAVIWAVQAQNEEPSDTNTEEELAELLPEVDIEQVTDLEIHRPAGEDEDEAPEPVRLAKRGGEWVIVSPVEAEADQGVVDTALEKLDELEALRVAATNPENHDRMEVAEDNGIRVVARADGEDVIDFWIGSFNRGNTFVRREGEDRVIAVRGSIKFAFNKELKDWRNRRVLDVPPGDVTNVVFENANGAWGFARGEDDEWAQREGDEEIERFGSAKVQSIVASLARMRAVNFADTDTTAEAAGLGEGAAVVTMTVTSTVGGDDEEEGQEGEDGEDGEGEDEGGDGEPAETVTETVVMRLGSASDAEDREFFLVRDGDETIFIVSSFLAEKINVNTEAFQNPEPSEEGEGEGEAAAPAMPPGMPGMPGMPGGPHGGPGGPGGPGGGQIPPHVMQQIQQQLQKQQATMQ